MRIRTFVVSFLFAAIGMLLSAGASEQTNMNPDLRILKQDPKAAPTTLYKLKMSFDILDADDEQSDNTVECYAVVRVEGNNIAGATDGEVPAGLSRRTSVPLMKNQTLSLNEVTVPVSENSQSVKLEVTLYDKDSGGKNDVLGQWTTNADIKNGLEVVLNGDKAKLRFTLASKNASQFAKNTVKLSFVIMDSSDGFADNTVECWAKVSVDGQSVGGLERSKAKSKSKGGTLDLDPIVFLSDDVKLTIALFDKDAGSTDDLLGSWTTTLQAIKATKTRTLMLSGKQARATITLE